MKKFKIFRLVLDKQYYMVYNIIQIKNTGVSPTTCEKKGVAISNMSVFPISAALLDAMVLAVTENEDGYGYKITKDIQERVSVSESTLYPVLRRLQKNGSLETYDMPYMGRNRRYYRITESGRELLKNYRAEWREYKGQIDHFLSEEDNYDY